MRFRFAVGFVPVIFACAALAACGFSSNSSNIPPAPTASPAAAGIFLYVAQATDPTLGTEGGAVSVYNVAVDGGLTNDMPVASMPVVNPRRLLKHPTLPVLYVAGVNQIFAFDITNGGLTSLCPNGGLTAPCATNALGGSGPLDITIGANAAGDYLLYVSNVGNSNNISFQTRVSAYELGPKGELPANPSSQAQTPDSVSFQSTAVTQTFAYVSDLGASRMRQFQLQADGNLPDPPASPTPVGAPTPTPTPTPTSGTPTPTPSPNAYKAFGPARILAVSIPPSPGPDTTPQTLLYVVQNNQKRIGMYPISTPTPPDQTPQPGQTPAPTGALSDGPVSESNTRGFYNALLIDPGVTHLYGAAFQNGQVDFYNLAADGTILDDTEGATSPDPVSYPTGLAWLEITPPGGTPQRILYVSLLGHNRIDAYQVNDDGSVAFLPFSSTTPIDGTSPSDILLYCPACP
jgi:6-phosphogluconolactonase (cycloisomerase 2 family)